MKKIYHVSTIDFGKDFNTFRGAFKFIEKLLHSGDNFEVFISKIEKKNKKRKGDSVGNG